MDVKKVPDLLAPDEVEELVQRYLDTTRDNMTEWMKNSLTSDKVGFNCLIINQIFSIED